MAASSTPITINSESGFGYAGSDNPVRSILQYAGESYSLVLQRYIL